METAFLLLGTNLGDRSRQLQSGREKLGRAGDLRAISRVYQTEPWGLQGQPEFWNQAVQLQTNLNPETLLAVLKEIELECGRISQVRWGPRELDIDIMAYGELILKTDILRIPHPRMKERRFALIPLLEIAPDWRDPESGKKISQLISECPDQLDVKLLDC